jgi:predicted transcriptional regulator
VREKPTPTVRELQILKVLWDHGPCSVKDVHRHLMRQSAGDRDLAYNTVQTLLRIMEEKKELVTHEVRGRTFIYQADYSREESATGFLDRVFDGAVSQLVLSLLRAERISAAELDQMQALIAEARRNNRGVDPGGKLP